MIKPSKRWAVFISGRGSNLQSWLDQSEFVDLRLVVSSQASALGLFKARRRGVSTLVLPKKIDWDFLDQELRSRRITHIMLAGFMKIVPESFIQKWSGAILNIHPSLLPEFPGLHAFEKSFEAGASMGVTVHEVIPEMDAGSIIYQKKVNRNFKNVNLVSLRGTLSELQLMRQVVGKWN